MMWWDGQARWRLVRKGGLSCRNLLVSCWWQVLVEVGHDVALQKNQAHAEEGWKDLLQHSDEPAVEENGKTLL